MTTTTTVTLDKADPAQYLTKMYFAGKKAALKRPAGPLLEVKFNGSLAGGFHHTINSMSIELFSATGLAATPIYLKRHKHIIVGFKVHDETRLFSVFSAMQTFDFENDIPRKYGLAVIALKNLPLREWFNPQLQPIRYPTKNFLERCVLP